MVAVFRSDALFCAGVMVKNNVSLNISFNDATIVNGQFLSGNITKVDLKVVNLLDPVYFVNQSKLPFPACDDDRSQVLLSKSSKYLLQTIYGISDKQIQNTTTDSFIPHIFAVKNALVNRDGGIFDAERFFHRGGCADVAWHTWPFTYDYNWTIVKVYNEPVIALGQPYEDGFAHELLDVYVNLITLRPVYQTFPNITTIVRAKLGHSKYFPLLNAFGIDPKGLNLVVLDNQSHIIQAPYVISALNYDCNSLPKSVGAKMQEVISELPGRTKAAKKQLLFYDRQHDHMRRLTQGHLIFSQLQTHFSVNQSTNRALRIVRFYGNESFEQTVSLFSSSSYVIGAHGAGLVNIMFMHRNTSVIEIRPNNFNIQVFDALAISMNIKHHVFNSGKGGWKGPITMKSPDEFIKYVETIIHKDY